MKKWITIILIIVLIAAGTMIYYQLEIKDPTNEKEKMTEVEFHNPKKFEISTNNEDYVSYSYSSSDSNKNCYYYISINDYNNYASGREYLEDRITFSLNDEVGEITENTINGIIWSTLKVVENSRYSQRTTYHYVTIKNEKTYLFEYQIADYERGDYEGEKDDYCEKSFDEVISSIKIQ